MTYNSILDAIGNTPLVKLNKVTKDLTPTVYVKLEGSNPGQSAKDRIASHMISVAEKSGALQPGGTLIEATSGNTGFSLAMIAAVKGYKCVLTASSKISKEKVDMLKALGAEVVICPKDAKPDDPRSYYEMAKRLAREIPGAYYVNQNFNNENAQAHYLSTGPEIWEETKGKVTHLIASAGTGGTLSGTARFLKEQNPNIRIIAVDAYGSVLKKYHETGIYDLNEISSYRIEGTGKNIIPANVDFDVIDQFIKITDKDAALRARELARKEGILAGYSSGAGIQAVFELQEEFLPTDVVVSILPDHGSKYLGKIFNDEWMHEQGFMEKESTLLEENDEILINS
ncbi:cysteine synthase family protein [Saprospiraceae bacterium]|jgi:cystathionine beta-synthase|nr:cysteine synthase family protein [Saprospiraceae bacterium]MDF1865880.1 cysteine synthase family protein [Saprospiraceae bacterium]